MVKPNFAIMQTLTMIRYKLWSECSLFLIGNVDLVNHGEAKFRYQTNMHEIVQRVFAMLDWS